MVDTQPTNQQIKENLAKFAEVDAARKAQIIAARKKAEEELLQLERKKERERLENQAMQDKIWAESRADQLAKSLAKEGKVR